MSATLHVTREEVGPRTQPALTIRPTLASSSIPTPQVSSPAEALLPLNSTMMSARVTRTGFRAAQQFSVARPAVNGLRTYATPAQDVRPPVALFGVDGTYASALVWLQFPARSG